MEKDTAAPKQYVMTNRPSSGWKAATIVLASILAAVLICMVIIASGLMKLGLSLL
jgi:hypothetical protein